jgi:photosystem I P700 chlorophyll a apoprotein A1
LENAIRRLGTISPDGSISHITGGNFAKSAITINGWLRDFLWSQASQVIQSTDHRHQHMV